MFEVLSKFFQFSGKKNSNKFKHSIVLGLIEALASAMRIPAIMYILMGIIEGKPLGRYIAGSLGIMGVSIVISVLCKNWPDRIGRSFHLLCHQYCHAEGRSKRV